jgi:hypothetical protein
MQNGKYKLKKCARILSIVILLSFWKFPVYANPLTEQPPNSTENEMKRYSDLEVDTLIDELTEAAHEAIEQAAGEAARTAALEREVVLSREVYRWKSEAETQKLALGETKKAGRKNAIIAGLACLVGGLALGIGGTLIIGGSR